jgi:N-acetylmuramoyl-L-alanine amidase
VVSFNGNGSYSGYPAITKLEYEEQSEAFFLTIKGNSSLNYSTMSLDNPLRLVIDIEGVKADLPLDELENISIQNPLVNKLRVGQFTDDIVRVVLELTIPVGLEMLNKQGDKELTFLLRKNTIVGKLIVIDPGHGTARTGSSSDPGAIGSTGLMERDVVMDISSKVAAILTGKGANVVLTRNGTSTNLDLDGRINLANSLNADLFISIHANASLNKSMMGSSTYYYAPYSDPFLGSQRAERIRLAQLIQQSLVSHGGRPNLGIIENSFKVIRETNMPSVLVETAFISNATEEKLLADPNFRTKIAEGIAEGIESYFN